ncbi:MAG: hypothetical protein IGS23_14360 [Rivularia sp. T60_A2020_040]|nr:hypothetical protein [Rivularia sp. T60_A2020_040]
MNYFSLPSFKSWLKFFGWVGIKILVSFLQFLMVCLEKILEFLLWCTRQSKITLSKIVFVIDNLPYAAISINRQEKILEVEAEVLPPEIQLTFFEFTQLRNEPDKFPHIRVIGKTGVGKTRFTEWIMDMLGGEQFVITPKKKPTDWINHKVYGYPFNYGECEAKLKQTQELMYKRYEDMEKGVQPHQINFSCDEWKLINKNVSSAKEVMKDIIIVARDAKIRLIALAQGENVATWGLEGESDLEECFTTVRFGEFAKDHCKYLRNKYRKGSEEFQYYSAMLKELESQGFRCCMVDNVPARVPNLANWKPSFNQVSDSFDSSNNKVLEQLERQLHAPSQNHSETTVNQEFEPENQIGEGEDIALWQVIKGALDEGRSVDWCAKNIDGLPGNYYSARAIVEKCIKDFD